MLTLGIHCAGNACEVAILSGEDCLSHITEPMKRGHDQRLPVLMRSALNEANIEVRDIGRIAVCVGPGSFTGIRVGVAFARGLALANGLVAVGVTSLEAMSLVTDASPSLAILPAKQRLPDLSFWTQGFGLPQLTDPAELSIRELEQSFEAGFVGIARPEHIESMAGLLPEVRWTSSCSDARNIARYARLTAVSALRPASPVYVREPDAIPAGPIA